MCAKPLPGSAPADVLEGGPLLGKRDPTAPKRREDAPVVPLRPGDYTPGAGGALTGPESALSSLPSCPCDRDWDPGPCPRHESRVNVECLAPSRPIGGPSLRCTAGHVFAGTAAEHEQARGALAAAERRAPHTEAERARTRDRLRAEVEAAKGGEER
jgi:hypothetical protein